MTTEVSPAHDLQRANERIDELAELEYGWYWGEAEPVPAKAVSAARELVEALAARNCPVPGIFPFADGMGLTMEYYVDTNVYEVEIYGPKGFNASCVDVTGETEYQEKELKSAAAAADFITSTFRSDS